MKDLKLKYGGGNAIDANTYINSLLHFTNVVHEVNNTIHPDKRIEVKIKAQSEGSFIVDLVVQSAGVVENLKNLFSAEAVGYIADICELVGMTYAVAKFLKGKKPKEVVSDGESAKIINQDGEVNYFDLRGANIYLNSPKIQNGIAKGFETLNADNDVDSFEITDNKEEPLVSVGRDDFDELSHTEITEKQERVDVKRGVLRIVSVVFGAKKKWAFVYEGIRIEARITDDVFLERVANREPFAHGDALEVEMDIKQIYDDDIGLFINDTYTVTKVIQHISKSEQKGVFDNDKETPTN